MFSYSALGQSYVADEDEGGLGFGEMSEDGDDSFGFGSDDLPAATPNLHSKRVGETDNLGAF
jgi:hypothetical protein